MKLNKKEKNYLLSTLFKGYVIQCAICSVLIFGGTFLLGRREMGYSVQDYKEHRLGK